MVENRCLCFHPSRNRIGQDIICVIAPVCQQDFRRNTLYQVDSCGPERPGGICLPITGSGAASISDLSVGAEKVFLLFVKFL